MDAWRYSAGGINLSLRVTPRGGRDGLDGIETLADGRKVRRRGVRGVAAGGGANRAVLGLLAKSLGVPKGNVRLLSGATSRLKRIAIDGDPKLLDEALRVLNASGT